jgi:hypothetical protein
MNAPAKFVSVCSTEVFDCADREAWLETQLARCQSHGTAYQKKNYNNMEIPVIHQTEQKSGVDVAGHLVCASMGPTKSCTE